MIAFKYELFKKYDRLRRFIAWHLPKGIVMWCYMRVAVHATTGKNGRNNASDVSMMDAIDIFCDDFDIR